MSEDILCHLRTADYQSLAERETPVFIIWFKRVVLSKYCIPVFCIRSTILSGAQPIFNLDCKFLKVCYWPEAAKAATFVINKASQKK